MIAFHENQLVIMIPTDRPAEALGGLQLGLVEVLKSTLARNGDGEVLALSPSLADGCLAVVGLLEATLVDPNTVEAALHIAGDVSEMAKRIQKLRGETDELLGR